MLPSPSVPPPYIFMFIYLSRCIFQLIFRTKDSMMTAFITWTNVLFLCLCFYIFLQMFIVPLNMFTCWKIEYMNIYTNVTILFCSLKFLNVCQKTQFINNKDTRSVLTLHSVLLWMFMNLHHLTFTNSPFKNSVNCVFIYLT